MDELFVIANKVWHGKITVSLRLSNEEIRTLYTPEKYYLVLSRCSYFHMYLKDFKAYFKNIIKFDNDIEKVQWWLEFKGKPIKWHYPVGVLYDLYNNSDEIWDLIIHFENYPIDDLLAYSNQALEAQYYSMLKEADYLQNKSKIINSLESSEIKQLWCSMLEDDFYKFFEVNCKLRKTPPTKDYHNYHVPFKIYRPHMPPSQKSILFYVKTEDMNDEEPVYKEVTMSDLLAQFNFVHKSLPHQVSTDFQAPHNGDTLPIDTNPIASKNLNCWYFNSCVCQGIDIPLSAPLTWLYYNLSNPDNFLHIILLP